MATDRQHNALQVIFSFFLGLMLVAFIGVGVNTFYPAPDQMTGTELDDLYRQQADLESARGADGELTSAQQAQLDDIRAQIDAAEQDRMDSQEGWSRNTSIILILFATLVMGISLVRSEELQIISNGLLLGGLFTMVYGVGWGIASGSSIARFVAVSFALVVTFALGYARFVRSKVARSHETRVAAVQGAVLGDEAYASLDARLSTLEARAQAAAKALGNDED